MQDSGRATAHKEFLFTLVHVWIWQHGLIFPGPWLLRRMYFTFYVRSIPRDMRTFLCNCHHRQDEKLQPVEDLLSVSGELCIWGMSFFSIPLNEKENGIFFFPNSFWQVLQGLGGKQFCFAEVTGALINYTSELCICFYQQYYTRCLMYTPRVCPCVRACACAHV